MHEIYKTSPLKMPKLSQKIEKLLFGIFGQTVFGRLPDNTEELA